MNQSAEFPKMLYYSSNSSGSASVSYKLRTTYFAFKKIPNVESQTRTIFKASIDLDSIFSTGSCQKQPVEKGEQKDENYTG